MSVKCGILSYIEERLTYCSAEVKQAILDTPYTHGTTNTASALRYVTDTMYTPTNGDRSDVADLVIILTDGGSNDPKATVTQGLRLKAKGVHVLAVGVGNWLNKYELESIASHPDSRNVMYISSYDNLRNNRDAFVSYMCGSTSLSPLLWPMIAIMLMMR